jgi:hypothetical protein
MTPQERRDAWMLFAAAALSAKVDAYKNHPANGYMSDGDRQYGNTYARHAAQNAACYADAMIYELEKRKGLVGSPAGGSDK